MGVRVIQGDQVGYSYSEDLSPSALLNAARVASQIASNGQSMTVPLPKATKSPITTRFEPWDAVTMQTRVNLLRKWEERAFSLDSRVRRVDVFFAMVHLWS